MPPYPANFSPQLQQLIKGLLVRDTTRRLGCGVGGPKSLSNQRFYAGFDWQGLLDKRVPPPFVPTISKKIGWKDAGKDDAKPWNLIWVALVSALPAHHSSRQQASQKSWMMMSSRWHKLWQTSPTHTTLSTTRRLMREDEFCYGNYSGRPAASAHTHTTHDTPTHTVWHVRHCSTA